MQYFEDHKENREETKSNTKQPNQPNQPEKKKFLEYFDLTLKQKNIVFGQLDMK